MNRNSALLWLPAIEAAGLPTPRTIVVPFSMSGCLSIFDGEASPEFDRLVSAVSDAGSRIGWPVFVRTELGSAKHDGPKSYRATPETVSRCLGATIEDHELKHMCGPYAEAFLVREFLDLDADFTAFGGIPIGREWRFFADQDRVICKHPYWPDPLLDDWVAGIVEAPDFGGNAEAALRGFCRDNTIGPHGDIAPSGTDGASFNGPAVTVISNFVLQCYEQFGLPSLKAKIREQGAASLGCARGRYSAMEQRLAILATRADRLEAAPEQGLQQGYSFRLDLTQLNHRGEAGALLNVDGKTSVCIENASKVREGQWVSGWAVFHLVGLDTILCWFQPDGECLLRPSSPLWKELLADHHKPPTELEELKALALAGARAQGAGAWSVDLARDRSGKWWLTDMATMQDSYHWLGCPNGEAK